MATSSCVRKERGRVRRPRSWPGLLDGLLAVLREEGLLERRLAADEVEQLVLRGRTDDRRDRPRHAHPQRVVLDADLGHAGQALEGRDRNPIDEAQLDLVVREVTEGLDA